MLGRSLTIGVTPVTIVAVMPASFAFPYENIDVWMPAAAAPLIAFDRSTDVRRLQLAGRLRSGVSLAQAADDVARAGVAVEAPGDRQEGGRRAGPALEGGLTRSGRPRLPALALTG